MKSIASSFYGLLALWASPCILHAEVRLPSLFGDNMVLQAGMPVPVWGKAQPGEKVTVSFAGQTVSCQAGPDGRFKAVLAPLVSDGTAATMTVSGSNTLSFTNVLVGEVWLGSGQSNMAFKAFGVKNAREEVATATWPRIRLFTVSISAKVSPTPLEDVTGAWKECNPSTVGYFSAVGYFFGRELHRKLEVPVGLIDSSRGGTPAEAWTRLARLEADPELKVSVDLYNQRIADAEGEERHYQVMLARWEKLAQQARAESRREPPRPERSDPANSPSRPGNLYNTMIAPLMPFAIRGVTWYQGEGNATRADRYARLFPTLIQDWRHQWGQGDFPFLFVQLANYGQRFDHPTDHPWARLREAQLKTLPVPNTGMAVAIDIGDEKQIHPLNKQDVGGRLAALALHNVYGKTEVVPSGPIFQRMTIENDRVRVTFTHLDGGLVNRAEGSIRGFALAGDDHRFVWADADIDGDTVVVKSPQVKQPVAVRYGWGGNPDVSLYNKAGLPASPFRTDDWSTQSAGSSAAGTVAQRRYQSRSLLVEKTMIAFRDYAGKSPPLVLIPGSWNGAAQWDLFVEHFDPQRRVIVIEMRGHGQSWPPPENGSIGLFARDVLAVMDHLGVEQFHVGGHSIGGMIAIELAGRQPRRVLSCLCAEGWAYFKAQHDAFPGSSQNHLDQRQRQKAAEATATMVKRWTMDQRQAFARIWTQWDGRPLLRDTELPVLQLYGDRGRSPATRAQLHLPEKENIQLRWIAGASHSDLPLAKPQEVAREFERFLRRVEVEKPHEGAPNR